MFENICEAIHRELYALDDKYMNGTQLSGADLKDVDTMAHALKNLKAYEAMVDSSYRNRTTPRYERRY